MTAAVQNTLTTNSFDFWRNRTNELAYAMSTLAVTVNSNTAVGNAVITGTFTANVLTISNGSISANISVPTAAQQSNKQYYPNANGTWTYIPISNNITVTSDTSPAVIDYWPIASWNTAEYLVSVIDNNANNFYSAKLIVTHDTGSGYITEYASFLSNSAIGVFSATTNTTAAILNFTPTSSNTTVKFSRVLI